MNYLLDTNIISDLVSSKPNKNVAKWVESVPQNTLYLSVLTLGEIRSGIERREDGKRKNQLIAWLEHQLPQWFAGRILLVDHQVADRWGYLVGGTKRTLPMIDSLLAATALTNNLVMVTRNVKDFDMQGLEVINPFLD